MTNDTAVVQGMIELIVKDVFDTMVNCPLEISSSCAPMEGARVTAFLGIGGKKKYTVMLECGEPLACKAAGAMLMDNFPEWSDSVQDALSEIANMIAGNVKSKLPEHLQLSLSLPTVVRGCNYSCSTTRMKVRQEVSFNCEGLPLTVRIIEEEGMLDA